ncbi:Gfo/Idh/MocA family oxidoreductase [Ligilactobacillus equi]|uniref:Oxidoreductase, Gfo/Idh/MocA family n=1 Tax=Ligilactobacillus equi DPC 6820 TaxID=1392007 RepID=V7HTS1_9LACO|nr:Gfo/Idh/MocA family oxidoreductase [Ligilactobacillus equi]ETA73619.1 oxidoreductase, Gfo/Idh/MocA family [Ligilactobacillus equi DPC 6820]MCQ2557307.1 Gfo/Idh/MocA family oxidoreductase [Ligilactobacillus sp.]
MVKLGVIGTGAIALSFVKAARSADYYKLTAVYSRRQESGQAFVEKTGYPAQTYTSIQEFFQKGDFSVVYIASPNSLHFEQIKLALEAGKDVIVEKPMVINPKQMAAVKDLLAQHPENYLFEAARHLHEPAFQVVQEAVASLEMKQGGHLTYMKYSSKYDAYLAGEEPNVFTTKFAGGALQDLGIYLVYDAVAWFGKPASVEYKAHMLKSGVDGSGEAILHYPDFDLILHVGKTMNSYLPGEIYGRKETIVMDNAAELTDVKLVGPRAEVKIGGRLADENPLLAEAMVFGKILVNRDQPENRQKAAQWLALAEEVNQVLYDLRQSAGIVFDDEK